MPSSTSRLLLTYPPTQSLEPGTCQPLDTSPDAAAPSPSAARAAETSSTAAASPASSTAASGWRWRLARVVAPGSIATRLILLSLLLVSLTAALTGSLAFIRARSALEKETQARLDMMARSIADHLHREIDDRWSDLSSWTRLEVMRALLYGDVDKQLAQFVDHML